jgi:hypothetical protein
MRTFNRAPGMAFRPWMRVAGPEPTRSSETLVLRRTVGYSGDIQKSCRRKLTDCDTSPLGVFLESFHSWEPRDQHAALGLVHRFTWVRCSALHSPFMNWFSQFVLACDTPSTGTAAQAQPK